ncbi:2-oxoacid:ferredoxin oxidoreductase subunit beta [Chloroflexus sp.]|uniref:2-oxoacid:ferredoxin oxidoreductase subunit beta n=1 Tax=Chloroflexus sp. TaxID=1904827 RepID=UPI00298F3370|nr:2-oxoacid:ferredoxin oxidoreductase subunit beta [Chloroflexus sp.]MCS6887721.1 2-oxoacid:ferredoxin oxidoreductase subunit beta [Chloroflexus sp.]MCX7859976.1 2-oxoacid:ferredoxin oxidoreductase subunit beta [Chloroflexus sp.]MDW8403946.1 2-oxoacid:ferredoxin oxidoreductase subunit beta [Chloroflexus sp.]
MTQLTVNAIGLSKNDYRGAPSTLCAGCGHDSVASQIIAAAFELSLQPHTVIRMSGIGCSSKSAAYFLGRSHGFNSLHGRMPSVTTGAHLANHTLRPLAVSGDGDTASIGLGQFIHLLRRNVPMVYIVENNGVYGLTKGQFSATADEGQELKHAGVNHLPPIDVCAEAILAGCGFVARSFAGDAKQVRELIKAAFNFHGAAVIDVISPCVTFNNHDRSTKSYTYGKTHESPIHDISFIPHYEEVTIDYAPGEVRDVQLHDGPVIRLRKLHRDHDPTDRLAALALLEQARVANEFVTGLIYLNERRPTLAETLGLGQTPIAALPETRLRPTREAFAAVMAELVGE